jgi:hypothetical protein
MNFFPRTLKDYAELTLVLSTLACVVIVGVHLPGWCRGFDHLQEQAQVAAGSAPVAMAGAQGDVHALTGELTTASRTIALDVHRDVVVAGAAEGETEKTMRLVRGEAPQFFSEAHTDIQQFGSLLSDARQQIPVAGTVIVSSRKLIDDADTTITGKSFKELLSSSADASRSFALTAHDTQAWWHAKLYPPKATGKAAFLVNSYRVVRAGSELGYYLTNLGR